MRPYAQKFTLIQIHAERSTHAHRLLTVYHPQGTDFHPKYTGENLTCTVQGLKRSTQYKFRVSDDVTWMRVCFLFLHIRVLCIFLEYQKNPCVVNDYNGTIFCCVFIFPPYICVKENVVKEYFDILGSKCICFLVESYTTLICLLPYRHESGINILIKF